MNLVFATNNQHKLEEVKTITSHLPISIQSLRDIHCQAEIPETAPTLEGNALQKARFIYERYGLDCFADDTGLEVEALDGAPGVFSARYAGEGHDSEANMQKLPQTDSGFQQGRLFITRFRRRSNRRTILPIVGFPTVPSLPLGGPATTTGRSRSSRTVTP